MKQAESLAAENVELRRMGEDALLDKCVCCKLPSYRTTAGHGKPTRQVQMLRSLGAPPRTVKEATSAQGCDGRPQD